MSKCRIIQHNIELWHLNGVLVQAVFGKRGWYVFLLPNHNLCRLVINRYFTTRWVLLKEAGVILCLSTNETTLPSAWLLRRIVKSWFSTISSAIISPFKQFCLHLCQLTIHLTLLFQAIFVNGHLWSTFRAVTFQLASYTWDFQLFKPFYFIHTHDTTNCLTKSFACLWRTASQFRHEVVVLLTYIGPTLYRVTPQSSPIDVENVRNFFDTKHRVRFFIVCIGSLESVVLNDYVWYFDRSFFIEPGLRNQTHFLIWIQFLFF